MGRSWASPRPSGTPSSRERRLVSSTPSEVPWYVTELVTVRVLKGVTQRELATAMSTTQAMVSGYESGRYHMKVDVLARWAEALGLELHMSFYSKSNTEENKPSDIYDAGGVMLSKL